MAPCSRMTACTKSGQSRRTKGEVTAKTTKATRQARRQWRQARACAAARSSSWARRIMSKAAVIGAARMGRALNLEATARPMPTPVSSAAFAVRCSTINMAP